LILASVSSLSSMTFIGIVSVASHFVLSEMLMKGMRKSRMRLVYPWIVITLCEEIILLSLAASHISEVVNQEDSSLSSVMGFFVVTAATTGDVTMKSKGVKTAFRGEILHLGQGVLQRLEKSISASVKRTHNVILAQAFQE